MAAKVIIPRESQSMETANILKWHVKPGDKVEFGQPLCEVESEKVVYDIDSPVEGTLLKVYYEEGQDVPVLTPIALVGKPGEAVENA